MKKTLITTAIITTAALTGCDEDKITKTKIEYADKHLMTITEEIAGSNCEFGGNKVINGIDLDGNDVLEGVELESAQTTYVCTDQGMITQVIIENPGVNCAGGGQRIDSGVDTDSNGSLEDGEITNTDFACSINATQEQINAANAEAIAPYLVLQTDLDAANVDLTNAQAEVDRLQGELDTTNASLTSANVNVDQLTADLNAANVALTSAQANVSQLTTELATATASLAAANSNVTQLTADLATANASVAQLTADLASANGNVGQLTTDLATANAALSQAQSDLSTANALLATANSNVTQLTTDLANANANVAQLTTDLAAANAALSQAQADLATANASIGTLQAEKTTLEAQLLTAQTSLTQSQVALDAVRTEMIQQLVSNGLTTPQATALASGIAGLTNEEIGALIVAGYLDTRVKIIFGSSLTYNGNLGGLAGADAKCQALADASTLPTGTYKAWLSSSTISAASRLSTNFYTYTLPDGTLVASSWTDLTDGSLHVPILMDENGSAISTPAGAHTNTNQNGSIQDTRIAGQWACFNWTEGRVFEAWTSVGNMSSTTQWSDTDDFNLGGWCDYQGHLYCLQQ